MRMYETWWFWVLAGIGVVLLGTLLFLLVLRYFRNNGKLPRRLVAVRSVSSTSRLEES